MLHGIGVAARALALFLVLNAPAAADQLGDGLAAYGGGRFAAALQLLQPLAEQGDARAQFTLGDMYMFGEGVARDAGQAVTWYRLAADHDYPNAQYALGFMYLNGLGVARDYVQAMAWFEICARHAGFTYFGSRSADLVKRKMTPAQIAAAHAAAQAWKAIPAEP